MKYVLIVENDDTCFLCPLCEVEFGWLGDIKKGVCRRTYDDVTVYLDGVSGRPKWCPLRPMPSYKAVDLNDTRDVLMFCHGWNICLADITEETDWWEQYLMLR